MTTQITVQPKATGRLFRARPEHLITGKTHLALRRWQEKRLPKAAAYTSVHVNVEYVPETRRNHVWAWWYEAELPLSMGRIQITDDALGSVEIYR